MAEPLFWLGLSILLVAVSLTAVLIAALPALQELARAARSAEKLFDTLSRELPPTLESIRLTGSEIANLTEGVNQNVQSAGRVVEQLDQSLTTVKQQAQQAHVTTRSLVAGVKAAWQVLRRSPAARSKSGSERSDLNDLAEEFEPDLLESDLLESDLPESGRAINAYNFHNPDDSDDLNNSDESGNNDREAADPNVRAEASGDRAAHLDEANSFDPSSPRRSLPNQSSRGRANG